jgi:serine/threonine protein kinase
VSSAASKTVTHRPAAKAVPTDTRARTSAVDLAEFQRAIVAIGLIDAEELARFVVTPDEVSRLAGALVRAGKLTAYQAAALAQGKAKGLVIGEYLVLEKLGQGGMGVVFKARHSPSGPVVALKILPPSFGRDGCAVDRFRREVEIASRLDHPNVVTALDTGEVQGVHFLATEYISGYDLDRLVTEGGPLPVDLALHCTIHAARGLAAAHAQGIIHRDVKPANVMLDDKGAVRVLDLGLARVVEAGNLIGGSPVGSLTQSGAYMGTVDFMAPEQADDPRKVDHRADIYSLGCTLYFLLTGRPPFLGDTVLKRLMAHQERPAPSLRAARPEVTAKLEEVYLQLMAKGPAERPDSMADVIDLLEACRSSPENEEEARSDLTIFAKRAFKRAVPRGRDRGPDASIFARRAESEDLQWDPNLRFEDVVMDLRKEAHTEPLPEEKLPPIVSRPLPKRVRRRRSAVPYGWIGFALLGLAAVVYALRPGAAPVPAPAPGSSAPSPTPPGAIVASTSAPVVPLSVSKATADARFERLFNGKDLTGWKTYPGQDGYWFVEEGRLIGRNGNSMLFTERGDFEDFHLRVEARVNSAGNSGVFFRIEYGPSSLTSTPHGYEAQIALEKWIGKGPFYRTGSLWDLAPVESRLHLPDTWFTMEVIAEGNHILTKINGKDVASFIDRQRLYSRGHLALQCFDSATRVEFRKVEIQELSAPKVTAPEFRSLFNGKDLTGWAGAVEDFEVRDGLLACKRGKRGAIYEPVERSDFVARVEFRLAPGAEGGLWIHYPGYGDRAYDSMCEIQILDDTHPSYANINPRIFHGSAWGLAAAKRGHLKALGEWNVQEVTVRGSTVKVELNGEVILDTNLAPIRDFLEGGRPYPAKDRTSGYFGVQSGLGTNQGNVQYRKIEIRNLATPAPPAFAPLSNGSDEPSRPTQDTLDGTGRGWKALGQEDFVNVNCDPRTWSWKDGVLHGTGQPDGVIRTRKPFTNFELVAQWRVLRSGGSSGIVVWTKEEFLTDLKPGSYMRGGIELQILDHGFTEQYEKKTGKPADWFTTHGDVFPVGSSRMKPFPPVSPDGSRSFPSKRRSKGVGEWNHYYVRCINGVVRLWVNGEQVSGGSGCDPASGYLCLESESSRPVEFRQLRIRELP